MVYCIGFIVKLSKLYYCAYSYRDRKALLKIKKIETYWIDTISLLVVILSYKARMVNMQVRRQYTKAHQRICKSINQCLVRKTNLTKVKIPENGCFRFKSCSVYLTKCEVNSQRLELEWLCLWHLWHQATTSSTCIQAAISLQTYQYFSNSLHQRSQHPTPTQVDTALQKVRWCSNVFVAYSPHSTLFYISTD